MFDDALDVMADITGIEYVIVDDVGSAHVEAYLGHEGNERVNDQLGEHCSRQHCVHSFSSTYAHDTVDGAIISYLHRGEVELGEGTRAQRYYRSEITDYTKQALLPVGLQIRPFLQGLRDPTTHLRPHDVPMYRLIYSPKAVPGMLFDDLQDLVVFDDETLDYSPSLPPGDLIIHKMTLDYFEAGSISVNMIGKDLRGARIRTWYATNCPILRLFSARKPHNQILYRQLEFDHFRIRSRVLVLSWRALDNERRAYWQGTEVPRRIEVRFPPC